MMVIDSLVLVWPLYAGRGGEKAMALALMLRKCRRWVGIRLASACAGKAT